MKPATAIGVGVALGLLLLSRRSVAATARQYEPYSPEAVALFRQAAPLAGVPEWWAEEEGLHYVLDHESSGWVGRPNYTFDAVYGDGFHDPENAHLWPQAWADLRAGRVRSRSSATGLGQMLLSGVRERYPSGAAGIGDPLEEAVGMLRYIRERYGDPDTVGRYYRLPKCSDVGIDPETSRYSPRALEVGCKPGGGY